MMMRIPTAREASPRAQLGRRGGSRRWGAHRRESRGCWEMRRGEQCCGGAWKHSPPGSTSPGAQRRQGVCRGGGRECAAALVFLHEEPKTAGDDEAAPVRTKKMRSFFSKGKIGTW